MQIKQGEVACALRAVCLLAGDKRKMGSHGVFCWLMCALIAACCSASARERSKLMLCRWCCAAGCVLLAWDDVA